MLRVTFFAIPNQMEIKGTEVRYVVRKPRWKNNKFTRSIAASSGHSKAELDIRRCTLVSTARRTHLPLRISADSVLDRYSEIHVGGGGRYSSFHHAKSVRVLDVLVPQRAGGLQPHRHSRSVTAKVYYLRPCTDASSTPVLIALRPVSPRVSFLGSVGAIMTFLTTVSFLFTTPGVIDHSHAVPLLGELGGFLIKDLALLGCAVLTAAEARGAYSLGGDRF